MGHGEGEGAPALEAQEMLAAGQSGEEVFTEPAAVRSMGNALRQELAGQGTSVTSVHLGAADTDMTKGYDVPKTDPADVARIALDGVDADAFEVSSTSSPRWSRRR